MLKATGSRRTKRSVVAAAALAGVLVLGAQFPGASAAVDPFAPYDPLSDEELSVLRGGFNFAGQDWLFGIEVMVQSIIENAFGSVGLVTVLKLDEGGIETQSTTLVGDGGITTANATDDGLETSVATEDTIIIHKLAEDGLQLVLSTNGNEQDISTVAEINVRVPSDFQAVVQSFAQSIPSLRNLTRQIGLAGLGVF